MAGMSGQSSLQKVLVLCQGLGISLSGLCSHAFCVQHCRVSPGTLSGVERLLQRSGHHTLKPLGAWQIAFVVTGPPSLP